jgi:hypothetical protein
MDFQPLCVWRYIMQNAGKIQLEIPSIMIPSYLIINSIVNEIYIQTALLHNSVISH